MSAELECGVCRWALKPAPDNDGWYCKNCTFAADKMVLRLTELEAEVARLRDALGQIAVRDMEGPEAEVVGMARVALGLVLP